MAEPAPERLIDPDCRDGKHGSCVGGPCECMCHDDPERTPPDGTTEVERLRAELAEAEVNERRDREQINRLREKNNQHMLNAESDVCTGCMQREQQRDAAWKTARQNGIKYEETKQAWHREQDRAKRAEAERDALKAAVVQVRADAIEQRRATGVTKDPWALGVYAQACRTLRIFNAAMDAPETTPDAPTEETDE